MKSITVQELASMVKSGKDFQLIDVREEDEHFEFNIGGQLIPLSEVVRKSDLISTDKPVILYCRKGIRSQFAIQKLMALQPCDNLFNLIGGTEAWKKFMTIQKF